MVYYKYRGRDTPQPQEQMTTTEAISTYTQELINKINDLNTNTEIHYSWDWGTKFHRIAKYDDNHDNSCTQVATDDRAFLFVSQANGDVIDAKGWNRRGRVLYNILNKESRDALYHELEVSHL